MTAKTSHLAMAAGIVAMFLTMPGAAAAEWMLSAIAPFPDCSAKEAMLAAVRYSVSRDR